MPEASSYAVNSELSLSNQCRVLSSPWWRLSGPRKPSLHQRCHPSGLVGGSRKQQTLLLFDRWYKRSQRPNNRKTVCSSDPPWKTGLPDRLPCPLYQRPLHQSREKRQTALKCHVLLKALPKFLGQRRTLLYPLTELCLHALDQLSCCQWKHQSLISQLLRQFSHSLAECLWLTGCNHPSIHSCGCWWVSDPLGYWPGTAIPCHAGYSTGQLITEQPASSRAGAHREKRYPSLKPRLYKTISAALPYSIC